MKSGILRAAFAALVPILALTAVPAALLGQDEPEVLPLPVAGRLEVDGEEASLPVVLSGTGPLVPARPLVQRFGGELEKQPYPEGGWILHLDDTRVIFGRHSASLIRDSEIVVLSRPPAEVQGEVLVPVDFLEHTFGDLIGYRFRWDGAARRLEVDPPQARELPVRVDLVHLSGVTTVVLQFPERPRYRIEKTLRGVRVDLLGGSVPSTSRRRDTPDDPLVERLEVGTTSVRLDLAPGAEAESYTLSDPFRLVFDVHGRGGGEAARPSGSELEPPAPRGGIETIVVDPGHGGQESGAVGPSGTEEKDLTLRIARSLKSRLESRAPVRVVLTRNEDVPLPLATRTAIANQNKADLFISIHVNSAAGSGARGAETYFLSLEASDERAAEAAAAENRVDAPPDGEADPLYDLQLILWDLAQSHHLAESQRLARFIQEELNGALSLRDRGVKQAPFRVLMGAAMPAVLVELGFLSNPAEEERLTDPAYRSQLVDALVRAVSRYRAQVERRGQAVSRAAVSGAGGDGESEREP